MIKIKLVSTVLVLGLLLTGCGQQSTTKNDNTAKTSMPVAQEQAKVDSTKSAENNTTETAKTDTTFDKPSGLLLGLMSNDKKYYTVYITYKNNAISLVKKGTGLLVPRKDGFWMVNKRNLSLTDSYGTYDYVLNADLIDVNKCTDSQADSLKLEPGQLFKAYAKKVNTNIEDCIETNQLPPDFTNNFSDDISSDITFVGSDYITMYNTLSGSNGYRGGAYNYLVAKSLDEMNKNNVTSLDSLINLIKGIFITENIIPLSKIFGSDAEKSLIDSASKYISENPDAAESLESVDGSLGYTGIKDKTWEVYRNSGHWKLEGILDPRDEAHNAYGSVLIKPNVNAPQNLVNYDTLVIPWNTLKKDFPKIDDAFSSPEKNILATLNKDNLTFYKISNSQKLKSIEEISLKEFKNPKVVMIQWCTGKNVDTWSEEAQKDLK